MNALPPDPADLAAPALPDVPVASPDPTPLGLYEPLLRLYLAAVATFGLALLGRWNVIGRGLDPEVRRDRGRRLLWTLGVFCPPVAAALIYETARLARRELVRLGLRPRAGSLHFAPTLYLTLWVIIPLASPGGMIAPLVLLAPLPFLLAQDEVNQLERVRAARAAEALPARPRRWLLLLALPATAALVFLVDRTAFVAARSARRLQAREVVHDEQRRISLTVAGDDWQQVGAGVLGDGDEKLGFTQINGGGWVVVYIEPRVDSAGALDAVVATRRQLIKEDFKIVESTERRQFLAGAALVPVSFASYRVAGGGSPGAFHVAAVILGGHAVEVMGFEPVAQWLRPEVQAFVESLQGSAAATHSKPEGSR